MKLEIFSNQANRIWKHLSESEETVGELLKLELDFYKKLLVIFQVGESCCFIFNFQQLQMDFVSDEVETLLGHPKEEVTTELIMESIHPEDRAWFLNCQDVCGEFLLGLPPEKQMKYKLRIDYRMKRRSGEYFRVLHQSVVVHNDDKGKIFRTLIVLTDISHLKQTGRPMLSYIGMEGEPSYQDIDVDNRFFEKNGILTRREKEVLYHLAEGRLSKEIAALLNVSKYTIDSHRKNLLQKMKVSNTGELIKKSIKEGFI